MEVYPVMIKKLLAAVSALLSVSVLAAYNPPAGGQNFLRLTEPQLLSGASSSAGGAIFSVTPASVVNNPALTAFEQRIVLDLAGTMLFDSSDSNESVGGATQAGILFPSRWGVSSFLLQGVWVPFDRMQVGNNIHFNASFAKDVTDKLAIGMSGNVGLFYGYDSDWLGAVDMGALYLFGDLAFMQNVRFSAALLNLGKMYSETTNHGIKGSDAADWPALATPKAGVAATLFNNKKLEIGASVDISAPGFQNFVLDAGVQLVFGGIVNVASGWEYDAREYSEGAKNVMPSVGVSCKFMFNSKDGSFLTNKGWQQSEMTVSAAWQQMYKKINAVSVGALLNLGLKDTEAPKIILWGEE